MTDYPIRFSPPTLDAIRAGRKTQTRRIIKDRGWDADEWQVDDDGWPIYEDPDMPSEWLRVRCPYGVPGDRLGIVDDKSDGWEERVIEWLINRDVRVQRVQDSSEEDAIAEGVSGLYTEQVGFRPAFATAWDDIYGPDAWARNDRVWALTFEREDRS